MIFHPTALAGVFLIDIEARSDERGLFARTVCKDEFARHGLVADFVQQSVSWNPHAGTLRGMHFQAAPHAEHKLVRVTRGAIHDVVVDVRRDSPGFGRWLAVELSASNRRQLYIPPGIAHGFQTLLPDTEVFYEMSTAYHGPAACGIRWNDTLVGMDWPASEDRRISLQDRSWPDLAASEHV